MHPLIFAYDTELREASERQAQMIDDFVDSPEENDVQAALNQGLFERLRIWRTKRAKAEKIAPYMVAHDTVLKELAARRPQSKQALLAVKGMGAAKIEKYGDDLLELLAEA